MVDPSDRRRTFAVLVDGDNAPPDVLRTVLLEVEKHGEARVRLVFGGSEALRGHREDANTYGFRPVLQFAVASRKNAADIALAISAIDLLHTEAIDAFCIVSSDSDFHPLATRLREAGRFVLGIGKENTPDALKSACHRFVSFEILEEAPEQAVKVSVAASGKAVAKATVNVKNSPKQEREPIKAVKRLRELLGQAYHVAQGEDGWAALSGVGAQLRILEPGFDPRNYGRKQLWMLAEESGLFIFKPKPPAGPNEALYVRMK